MYDLWDGINLKCTIRAVEPRLLQQWEVVQLPPTIQFSDEEDAIYELEFQLQWFIFFPVIIPCLSSCCMVTKSSTKIQFFLWLLSQNKVLTRDNVSKEEILDETCLFCAEKKLLTTCSLTV